MSPEEAIHELHQRILSLERQVESLQRHVPPPGWAPSNYVKLGEPHLSVVVDTHTRQWAVYHSGNRSEPPQGKLAEGSSLHDAVFRFEQEVRHAR